MAEIGGSPTDESALNLDNADNGPSTSHMTQKGGALKRQADCGKDVSAAKKKKSAEELASTTRGRNLAMKKRLKEQKKKQNIQKSTVYNQAQLLEHRDKLLARLRELKDRPMALTDKAEDKLLNKEKALESALIKCEAALDKKDGYEEEDERVIQSLTINLPDWPCLDIHVQEFAQDRLYKPEQREKGTAMTTNELVSIINTVRSQDPTIRLPTDKNSSEMERLLIAINWKINEAVRERRFEDVVQNLEEYPDVEPNAPDTVPDTAFSCPKPLLRVKREGVEAEREELNELVGKVIKACVRTEEEEGSGVITLDDNEDDGKEGDDDEMSEEGEEEEENDEQVKKEENEEDRNLLNVLDNHAEEEEEENQTKEDENEEDKKLPNDLKNDPGMDEMDTSSVEVIEDDEESKQNDVMVDKAKEEKDRPDSRDGKEIMEGGTSTNSPTLERDERMKEMEKIEDTKKANDRMDTESPEEATGTGETDKATAGKMEPKVIVVASTIMLDDEEEGVDGENGEMEEMKVIPGGEDGVMGWEDGDEIKIGPPAPAVLTPAEAWRIRVVEIQMWVNCLIVDPIDEEEPKPLVIDEEEREEEGDPMEEKDDEIVCLIDDFEMDSVSHSGLMIRQQKLQLMQQGIAEGEQAPPPVPPHRPRPPMPQRVPSEVEVIELD